MVIVRIKDQKNNNMVKKLIFTVVLGGFVLGAFAQNHKKREYINFADSIFQMNPVVVTGNAHHEYLKSSTTPVHVMTNREIEKTGVSTFNDALTKLMPNVEFMPNAMGSYLRLNGLGNKYILILINGRKITGDIAGNVELDRINMGQVKRIEVLNGAASSLYGSDAIGGVINIITSQPKDQLVSVTANTRISGKGQFTQSANVNISYKGLTSSTNFKHDEADSYRNNPLEYAKGNSGDTQECVDPLFLGYHTNSIGERLSYQPIEKVSVYGEINHSYKMTDRPLPIEGKEGGYTYDLRFKTLRFNAGANYKFSQKHSVQIDFTSDNYRYGYEYNSAASGNFSKGDYDLKKRQQFYDVELKNINRFTSKSTTIFGLDYRNDFLLATAGNTDNHAYTLSAYGQHDMQAIKDFRVTLGVRYDKHETFGSRFTPKVALSFAPGDFNFRINYARGFRAPGLDELYYHYFKSKMGGKPVVTFGNKDLNPETSDYISLSGSYTNNRFSITITGFMNFIDDMIVKDNLSIDDAAKSMLMKEFPNDITEATFKKMTTYGQYVNSDKGIIKGINVHSSYIITNDLSITANYAYTYARTKTAGVWETLERSVKNSATVAANYSHSWGKYTLNANLNGRFQSKTYFIDYENAPGFGTVSLNTTHSFHFSKFLVEPSLGVDNIFDKVDNRIDWSKRRYAYLSSGRMLVAGVKLKFN